MPAQGLTPLLLPPLLLLPPSVVVTPESEAVPQPTAVQIASTTSLDGAIDSLIRRMLCPRVSRVGTAG